MIIIAGCGLFCLIYIICTMRQDFYHAWRWLIPSVAACYLGLWSMPEVSAMLSKPFGEGDLRLLTLFSRSAAILLVGTVVLVVLRILIEKLSPLVDPEFPPWFDRPASFVVRLVTSLMIVEVLLQCGLAFPAAATFPGFKSAAGKADALVLRSSALLNGLSGQSSRSEKQRAMLAKLRADSIQEAQRIADAEKAELEKAAAENGTENTNANGSDTNAKPAAETPPPPPAAESGAVTAPPEVSGSSVSTPGTVLNRTRSRLRTIYDNHNRNLEAEAK